MFFFFFFFFFQAEDGIRDADVTGVQTCALPIFLGEVVGWAALSPASKRRCYAGVAENTVYVARDARGLGIGRTLLEALIAGAEAAGIWTIQTAIFPENRASLILHE